MQPHIFIAGVGIISLLTPVRKNESSYFDTMLSGDNQTYQISGFSGQFSSQSTNKLSISDSSIYHQDKDANLSCAAAKISLEAAAIPLDLRKYNKRAGVVVGSSYLESVFPIDYNDGIPFLLKNGFIEYRKMNGPVSGGIDPFWLSSHLIDTPSESIAKRFHVNGLNFNISNGPSNGFVAIGQAYQIIKDNRADLMITGGAEGHANIDCLLNLKRRGIATMEDKSSAPFFMGSKGVVLTSGSAILILENRMSQLERNIRSAVSILSYVNNYLPNIDRVTVNELSSAIKRSMIAALSQSGLSPENIGFIQANAIGIPKLDLAEAQAIMELFARDTPVTSCGGAVGYTLSASGAISVGYASLQLKQGKIAPITETDFLFYQDHVHYVKEEDKRIDRPFCLVNHSDFCGMIGSMVIAFEVL